MDAITNCYWSGDNLVVLRRGADGRLRETRQPAEYAFFIRKADWPKVEREVRTQESRRGRIAGHRVEGEYVRIVCRDLSFRQMLCRGVDERGGFFAQRGIEVYEADLNPVRRFLVDSQCDIQEPTWCCIDIETDSRVPFSRKEEMRVLCWSLYRHDGQMFGGVLEEDSDAAERELLMDFWWEVQHVDQVRSWNGETFDEPVLIARSRKLKIQVEPRQKLWLDHMQAVKKYNAHSTESGDEKQSVALGRVAESLGIDTDEKTSVDASKSWELWRGGGAGREALFRRNNFDARVMAEIEEKTGYCALHYAVCRTSGCLPNTRGLSAKEHVEAFVMRLGARKGMRFATNWAREGDEKFQKFEGAYVHDVVPGLHRDVHVCDFSGMYPAIIQSWNMGPDSHRPELSGREGEKLEDVVARLPEGHAVAPLTLQVFDQRVPSVISEAVAELKAMRGVHRKRAADLKAKGLAKSKEWVEADRLSQGAKIAVNSTFGVVSSPFSRLFRREVGESITTTGKWLILETIHKGQDEYQIQTVFSDTDSLGGTGVTAETYERFVIECNTKLYPEKLRWMGCARNEMNLEFDAKGGDTYAILAITSKKHYAARILVSASPLGKPIVKGLEYKRGDSLKLARQFQFEVIQAILMIGREFRGEYDVRPEDIEPIIERWKALTLGGSLSLRDFMISQSLKGHPDSYGQGKGAAVPVHARIAKVLEERGRDVSEGVRVEYVVVDGDASPLKAIPAEDWAPGMEDRAYLWERKVWPPTERLLEACWPHHRWSRFEAGKDRGGGRGQSRYLPGQSHMPWFD